MNKNRVLAYSLYEPFNNLLAFTTTRQTFRGAISPRFTGGETGKALENRKELAAILGIYPGQLVFPLQTHTNCVAVLHGIPDREIQETDALITDRPGICLCVQTADCVPVLLFDSVKEVIAAVHAGWRGTVKKIAEEAVLKMINNYDCRPENMKAVIGPSIGPGVYEVGDEVVSEVQKNVPNFERVLHENSSGRFHLNLWEANRQILQGCGIPSQNIETAGECTFSNQKKYFSARREGVNSGRIVSGIILKEVDNN